MTREHLPARGHGAGRKILFVLTNHRRLGAAGDRQAEETGFHLSETAHPWQLLGAAGFHIDLASPAGGRVSMDPSSADLQDAVNSAFLANEKVRAQLADTPALTNLEILDYVALYFPGGHGTMWDLPHSPAVHGAVRTMVEAGRPVAAVCHGPAALVNVKLGDGRWLVEGKTVSAFTDEEELATGKAHLMPFSLARKLVEHGAILHKAANFEFALSSDGGLITGQNPCSALAVARALRDRLCTQTSRAALQT